MSTLVYVEGSCRPNPGPGGWGVVIVGADGIIELCGGEPHTNTNRIELTAVVNAIEYFPDGASIEIICMSKYVLRIVERWMSSWKTNGWRGSSGLVKNLDLIQRLDELTTSRNVRWSWVRGKDGYRHNRQADRLASRGRTSALQSVSGTKPSCVSALRVEDAGVMPTAPI